MKRVECEKCNGNGWIEEEICEHCEHCGYDMIDGDPEQIVFVNIYSITRHYGGPEEGGWYYNHHSCIESVPVANKNSDLMKEEMQKRYKDHKYGDIYSVLGGRDIEILIEENPKESETRERPYYE